MLKYGLPPAIYMQKIPRLENKIKCLQLTPLCRLQRRSCCSSCHSFSCSLACTRTHSLPLPLTFWYVKFPIGSQEKTTLLFANFCFCFVLRDRGNETKRRAATVWVPVCVCRECVRVCVSETANALRNLARLLLLRLCDLTTRGRGRQLNFSWPPS